MPQVPESITLPFKPISTDLLSILVSNLCEAFVDQLETIIEIYDDSRLGCCIYGLFSP